MLLPRVIVDPNSCEFCYIEFGYTEEPALHAIGIDIGSTTIKGALLDLDSERIDAVQARPFPDPIPGLPAGHFEIDPSAVLAAVREVLLDLHAKSHGAEAAFFSGQMGGVILVDQDGQPCSNYISWRDQRTLERHPAGPSFLEVALDRLGPTMRTELGQELRAGAASMILFSRAENGLLPAGAIPASLGDYVVASLCGSAINTDPTQAIGAYHLGTRSWHREAFERLGLNRLSWPPLTHYRQSCGEISANGTRLRCFPVVGDHQCSLMGVGIGLGELSINVSTGSQVSMLVSEAAPGSYQTRAYFDGLVLNTLTHLPAGRSLNVLVDLLTDLARRGGVAADPWPVIAAEAAVAPDSGLAVNLAFFAGPLGERGSISNISTDNVSLGELFRAAFRNMAENYAVCAECLLPSRGWTRVVLSGGLPQKAPILRRFIVERFDCPFRDTGEGEDSLLGLMRLARNALMS